MWVFCVLNTLTQRVCTQSVYIINAICCMLLWYSICSDTSNLLYSFTSLNSSILVTMHTGTSDLKEICWSISSQFHVLKRLLFDIAFTVGELHSQSFFITKQYQSWKQFTVCYRCPYSSIHKQPISRWLSMYFSLKMSLFACPQTICHVWHSI